MIHVPDVRTTVDWYVSIGFKASDIGEIEGEAVWALLSFGSGQVMLNKGGKPSTEHRREVDLYVYVDNIDQFRGTLAGKAEIVEDLHDTFYGMREFIIRDCNRFWITFGEPVKKVPDDLLTAR